MKKNLEDPGIFNLVISSSKGDFCLFVIFGHTLQCLGLIPGLHPGITLDRDQGIIWDSRD